MDLSQPSPFLTVHKSKDEHHLHVPYTCHHVPGWQSQLSRERERDLVLVLADPILFFFRSSSSWRFRPRLPAISLFPSVRCLESSSMQYVSNLVFCFYCMQDISVPRDCNTTHISHDTADHT